MFVSPLYMLQVYDRVLHSRSEMTLIMITLIAGDAPGLWSSRMAAVARLVRAGMRFDEMIAKGVFTRVVTNTLKQPAGRSEFALMDIDRLREFFTGSGLIALCDLLAADLPRRLFLLPPYDPAGSRPSAPSSSSLWRWPTSS